LVALKAEEIREKAKKAKQREKKREMSTAKVRTALGGQQMSFQPQPQVEAPLRYQPQQQERSRLSDPWIGFGQNVALTLLNYGLMQAGRHQDRKMLAAQQQQKQQEKTVFKPEYKDVSFTDLKKGFGEISALKKRKIETITQPAAGFQTPNKKKQSERKKVVAVKSSGAGGLFDKFINRSTQSTQTETDPKPPKQEFGTQTGSTQTQEFGTQTETEQDRRNALALKIQQDRRKAIDAMGFDELLMAMADDNQIHPDDREYANNRVDTLRSQLFAQNEQGKHFLETNTREQNRSFFNESYKGGFIGSLTNTRGNVDPETGQTFIIVDGHRLNPDGSYELHPAGLIQQAPDEAMAILKAVREQKLEQFSKRRDLKAGFQAFVNNRSNRILLDAQRRGPVKGPIQMANPSELEENEQKTEDQRYNQVDESRMSPDRPTYVKPPPKNVTGLSSTSLSAPLSEELNDILNRQSMTPIKPDITPPPPGGYMNEIMRITGYTGVLPKMWLNIKRSVDWPSGDDLPNFKSWYNQDDESKDDESKMGPDRPTNVKPPPENATSSSAPFITPNKPIHKKPDITPPPPGGYDPKKLIQSLTNTVPNTPPKNPIYAPTSSSLDQSPSTFGFFGPTAFPGTLDTNVKGFYNKILARAKGGTPAPFFMGTSPSSLMTPQTSQTQSVEMSSIITDQAINERPTMGSLEIEENNTNIPEEENYNNFGSQGFDNENIEDEMENVGSSFTGESEYTGYD
jgi:hypothetical protein